MRKLLFGIAALVPLVLVACGGSSTDYETRGASDTRSGPAPVVIDLSKDDMGRAVELPKNPTRIVAMSPSIVELMYAVGATPVGRPSSADFPEQAKTVPSFGLSYQPNYEEVVAMKPDLLIADAIIQGNIMDQLTRLNIPVFALKIASFDDVAHALRVTGALTGNKDAGETRAKELETKLAGVKSKLPGAGPNFMVLVSAGPGQFIAAKDGAYLIDVVKQLGGKSIVTSSEPDNFRFPGFTDYSPERIVEKNPDVVFTMSLGGPPGTPKTSDALKSNPALSTIKAVKEGRVYEVDHIVYLQSAGPRVGQMLDELPRLLYPNVFASAR
jgi:iron complex transport system substrate-binding protein